MASNDKDESGSDDISTGTVTATRTKTGILEDAYVELLGINLDEINVEIEGLRETEEDQINHEKELRKQLKRISSNRNVVAIMRH